MLVFYWLNIFGTVDTVFFLPSICMLDLEKKNHFPTSAPWEHLDHRGLIRLGIGVLKVPF